MLLGLFACPIWDGSYCGSFSAFQQLWERLPQWRGKGKNICTCQQQWFWKKNVCPSPVSSRVESYEGRDRVLRPPHRHRLLRRLQWWMWAAVSPAAGSSGGWPHPLQHPDVLWVREHTHHFLFLFHDSNCVIFIFYFFQPRCDASLSVMWHLVKRADETNCCHCIRT